MNKYEEIAADIVNTIIDMIHEQHPDIKCQTDDEGTELSLIYGEGCYTIEQEIVNKIKMFDDDELEIIEEWKTTWVCGEECDWCDHKKKCDAVYKKIRSLREEQ